ncbi:hypothetical protein UlMin_003064 [Ulmus minor]
MALSSVKHINGMKIAVVLISIFSLTFFPSNSAGLILGADDNDEGLNKEMKVVLGSRPPRCVNKCLNCGPCSATLVTSQQHKNGFGASPHEHDQRYYLLAWKCKCRNKLFQP